MDNVLVLALAMFLILEGLGPLLFPKKWQRYILQIANLPPLHIRWMGALMVGLGTILWHVFH